MDVARADPEALHAVDRASRDLLELVSSLPSLASVGGPFASPEDAPLVERGPISGLCNALAPPLIMEQPEEGATTVRATAVFSRAYEGPPNMVHGGALLAAFDEVLAFGQVLSGHIGMTGTITVTLLGPVPIGEPVVFEAGPSNVEGRKTMVWATASVNGRVAAEATGVCIQPRAVPPPSGHR